MLEGVDVRRGRCVRGRRLKERRVCQRASTQGEAGVSEGVNIRRGGCGVRGSWFGVLPIFFISRQGW